MIQFTNGDLINLYMNSTNQQKILAEQGISQSNNKGKKIKTYCIALINFLIQDQYQVNKNADYSAMASLLGFRQKYATQVFCLNSDKFYLWHVIFMACLTIICQVKFWRLQLGYKGPVHIDDIVILIKVLLDSHRFFSLS